MDSALLSERLETTCRTFEALERQLADPSLVTNPSLLQTLAKERAKLEPMVLDYQKMLQLQTEQNQARDLLRQYRGDPSGQELFELAAEEIENLGFCVVVILVRSSHPKTPPLCA
jgi:peptide chain release factor 1